jgi:hypothetical protein
MGYGKILKIDKKAHEKIIDVCIEEVDSANTAFQVSAQLVKRSKENLFKQLKFIFPELEGYEFNFNHKSKTVTVLGEEEDN